MRSSPPRRTPQHHTALLTAQLTRQYVSRDVSSDTCCCDMRRGSPKVKHYSRETGIFHTIPHPGRPQHLPTPRARTNHPNRPHSSRLYQTCLLARLPSAVHHESLSSRTRTPSEFTQTLFPLCALTSRHSDSAYSARCDVRDESALSELSISFASTLSAPSAGRCEGTYLGRGTRRRLV